jgi:hypothetical protein
MGEEGAAERAEGAPVLSLDLHELFQSKTAERHS